MKTTLLLAATLLFSTVATAATEIGDDQYIIFYHNDALGSPLVVTDHNGNTLWHEHSDPFGRSRDRVMPTGKEFFHDRAGSRKGYTGHLKDSGSDLVYMKARHYDPVIGRFYSNDPVGFTASNPMMFNRYAYANDNPYRYVDPTGMIRDNWATEGYEEYYCSDCNEDSNSSRMDERVRDEPQSDVRKAVTITRNTQQEFPTGHNDSQDAERHFKWMKRLSQNTSPAMARAIGYLHELTGLAGVLRGDGLRETIMDLHNNNQGIDAGINNTLMDMSELIVIKGEKENTYGSMLTRY